MKKKKTIALLIFRYFPYGGLQRDFLEITKELLTRNLNLKVVTGRWEAEKPKELEIIELGIKGLTNHKKNINFFEQASLFLEEINPNLIFGFNKMPGLDVYFAADTCFKFVAKQKTPLYKSLPRYKAFISYEREVFGNDHKTKSFILNIKQEKEFIQEYHTDKSRLILIPPGLPLSWRNLQQKNNFKKSINLKESDKLILFAGSAFHRKGLDRAIRALSYCFDQGDESIYLAVAGKDKEQPFLNLVNKLKMKEKVIFLGPRDDVAEIMSSSDLLIHPAREEAAGNVIIEAMVSELPILTTKEVGFSSYVEEYDAGKIIPTPFTQNNLNKSLHSLISNQAINSFKGNLVGLRNNDFFFSRFKFIGDFIERELNA